VTSAPTVERSGTTFCISTTRALVPGLNRSDAEGMSDGSPSPIGPVSSAFSAPTETFGSFSPLIPCLTVTVRVARPQPRPTIDIVDDDDERRRNPHRREADDDSGGDAGDDDRRGQREVGDVVAERVERPARDREGSDSDGGTRGGSSVSSRRCRARRAVRSRSRCSMSPRRRPSDSRSR